MSLSAEPSSSHPFWRKSRWTPPTHSSPRDYGPQDEGLSIWTSSQTLSTASNMSLLFLSMLTTIFSTLVICFETSLIYLVATLIFSALQSRGTWACVTALLTILARSGMYRGTVEGVKGWVTWACLLGVSWWFLLFGVVPGQSGCFQTHWWSHLE